MSLPRDRLQKPRMNARVCTAVLEGIFLKAGQRHEPTNGALALRINKVTETLRKRQGSGEQKQQRPSSGMAVCITHDLNVSHSVWTDCLPARLTWLTARCTAL